MLDISKYCLHTCQLFQEMLCYCRSTKLKEVIMNGKETNKIIMDYTLYICKPLMCVTAKSRNIIPYVKQILSQRFPNSSFYKFKYLGLSRRLSLSLYLKVIEVFPSPSLFVGGILTNKATFEEGPREKTHVRHPSADLLSSYDLSRLKSKLGLGMLWYFFAVLSYSNF